MAQINLLDDFEREKKVQENLIVFCKVLPRHVDIWRDVQNKALMPLNRISNLCEQMICIEKSKGESIENFDEIKLNLSYLVQEGFEEEISTLKGLIEQLNSSNHELKLKISNLEKSTLDLNWDNESDLIEGNGIQPKLRVILQLGYDFYIFFNKHLTKIKESFKNLDILKEKSVKLLKESFNFSLDDRIVTYFLALMQYVDNEKKLN